MNTATKAIVGFLATVLLSGNIVLYAVNRNITKEYEDARDYKETVRKAVQSNDECEYWAVINSDTSVQMYGKIAVCSSELRAKTR